MGEPFYSFLMIGLTFLSFALLTYGLATYSFNRRVMRERYRGSEANSSPLIRGGSGPSVMKRFLDWLSRFGKFALKDEKEVSQLRSRLYQAGFRSSNAPAIFFGLRALCALALPLPFMCLNILQGQPDFLATMVPFMLVAAGYFLPNYLLQVALRRRQERMDRGLPDVLDLMIVCMEAGLALQATFVRVAEEIEPICKDLYHELQLTTAELRTGIPRETALLNLAERTGVPSVKSLINLMFQSEKMGASIAEALRTHADFIRMQRSQKAEEIASKLPVKILFPMMIFIMPALFIVILGPGAIRISRTLLQ